MQAMPKHVFWPIVNHLALCYWSYTRLRCCFTPNRWAWSLPSTWQRWLSHHSMHPELPKTPSCTQASRLYLLWNKSYCRLKFYIAGIWNFVFWRKIVERINIFVRTQKERRWRGNRSLSHKTRKSFERCDLYRLASIKNNRVQKLTRMMIISRICRTAFLNYKNTNVGMLGEVPNIVILIKFNVDRFMGFRSLGSKYRGIPVTRRVTTKRPVIVFTTFNNHSLFPPNVRGSFLHLSSNKSYNNMCITCRYDHDQLQHSWWDVKRCGVSCGDYYANSGCHHYGTRRFSVFFFYFRLL